MFDVLGSDKHMMQLFDAWSARIKFLMVEEFCGWFIDFQTSFNTIFTNLVRFVMAKACMISKWSER